MVRPLTSGILFNCLQPIYAVFSKGFGVFEIFTLVIGDLLPNVALYQTEPHLDGGFFNFSVSGQTCGQTTYIGNFIQLFTAELCSVFKGFVQCLQGLL